MNGPFLPLTGRISYFPATREPLSADIFYIMTGQGPVLFDVGSGPAALDAALSVPGPVVVLSHFHADHIGNLGALSPSILYVSGETKKHTLSGTVVAAATAIAEGITVLPFPNSHSKGSLALSADRTLLIGDALYPREVNGESFYNIGLVKEEIALIEKLAPDTLIVSHRKNPLLPTAVALTFLKNVYRSRKPGEMYVDADIAGLD